MLDKTDLCYWLVCFFFFQAEDGIRDAQESRGLGDVYKRQVDSLPARARADPRERRRAVARARPRRRRSASPARCGGRVPAVGPFPSAGRAACGRATRRCAEHCQAGVPGTTGPSVPAGCAPGGSRGTTSGWQVLVDEVIGQHGQLAPRKLRQRRPGEIKRAVEGADLIARLLQQAFLDRGLIVEVATVGVT